LDVKSGVDTQKFWPANHASERGRNI